MYLFDQLCQAKVSLVARGHGYGDIPVPGPVDLEPYVRTCEKRFVLKDDVSRLCSELMFHRSEVLASCAANMRAPAPLVWIEWRADAVGYDDDSGPMEPLQVGALLRTDETGRRGCIHVIWEKPGEEPVVCRGTLVMDLDAPIIADTARRIYPVTHRDRDFGGILSHFGFQLDEGWSRILQRDQEHRPVRAAVEQIMASMWLAGPLVIAFCSLLSFRSQMTIEHVDRSRLNAARAKQGRPALLDSSVASFRLLQHGAEERMLPFRSRSSARLHSVRGHFVRRGSSIFWRTAHLRGDRGLGIAPTRTQVVSL